MSCIVRNYLNRRCRYKVSAHCSSVITRGVATAAARIGYGSAVWQWLMGAFCVCRRGQQRLFCTTHHHRLASSSFLATAVGPSIDLMRLSATDGRVVRCGDARGRCSRSSFLNVFEHNVVICFRLEYRSGWCVSENTHTHTHTHTQQCSFG